ncbi:MAG TPA: DUF5312 family protein [Desulfobacterales bacterium]|nr:DUF5312 family protein [Desulfobacterales bacterium]
MPPTPTPKKMGFLARLIATVFGSNDPEWQRQRALLLLAKDLRRLRPRFYNPSDRLLEPAFARFLHDLFRTLAPANAVLRGAETSGALRLITVELGMSEEQQQLRERLSDQALAERAKTVEPSLLVDQAREELARFAAGFDAETIRGIDARFNRLAALLDLINYDYWLFLRKFDLAFPEHDLAYKPTFRAIRVDGALDEVKDLLEVVPVIDPQADWEPILAVLKEYKGIDLISRDAMRRLLAALREVQRTGVLLGIVRHASGNPSYRPVVRPHRERIVEAFLAKNRSQAELLLQKIAQRQTTQRIGGLVRQVFGADTVEPLEHYSERANAAFTGRMIGGYLHAAPLAYLRAFLHDSLQAQLRDIVDFLIIKGRWAAPQPSQQLSEAFHELLKISEAIPRFDAELAADGDVGRRMHAILVRADKERKTLAELRPLLQRVNDQARGMVTTASTHFVSLARVLKLVYDDSARRVPEQVVNWKDLVAGSDKDLRGLVAAAYKRIYGFMQLMANYK